MWRFLPAFVAVSLSLGILNGEYSFENYRDLQKNQKILEQTIRNLERETARLTQEITQIEESKDYARLVLKDKYHVTEPNEKIVFFAE